jgi:hypothetical protein
MSSIITLISLLPPSFPLPLSIESLALSSKRAQPHFLIFQVADIPAPHTTLPEDNMDKFVPEVDA